MHQRAGQQGGGAAAGRSLLVPAQPLLVRRNKATNRFNMILGESTQ